MDNRSWYYGNNIADELAKEAAEEAEKFPEDSETLTKADFKKFARASCRMKWQICWEAAETGRFLFSFKPQVSVNLPKYMLIYFCVW